MIIAGNAHKALAQDISKLLDSPLAKIEISKFPNGEKRIWVKDKLKDKTVIVVQPFSDPVDENIIEFCLILDAAHHLGAKKVIGVVPWLGYSPQDKLFRVGEPVSVHVIAKIIESLNLDHLILADIHSLSSLKYFTVPITHLSAVKLYINYFKTKNLTDHLVVALDKGALLRAKEFASALKIPLISLSKSRNPKTGKITFSKLSAKVTGKHIISFDDFVSTGSTRIKASAILKKNGALSYTDCITHALLTGNSSQKLQASHIDTIITTDSYPIPSKKQFPKLKILSIAPLITDSLLKLV